MFSHRSSVFTSKISGRNSIILNLGQKNPKLGFSSAERPKTKTTFWYSDVMTR